jgi:cell division protein FtsQ
VRKAAAERRRYEKSELRRFTRRSRKRRAQWLAAISTATVFATLVGVLVLSPVLSLTSITVTGTSRLDSSTISDAIADQRGKPLALIDFDRITIELSQFALIRSYTTESRPPHTLVVNIVERKPIGSIHTATGYQLVDPAGVVVESSAEQVAGVPLLEVSRASSKDSGFSAVVEVLLALPKGLESRVESAAATTKDDVTFVLSGSGQRVVWGSVERSAYKARVLAALIASKGPNAHLEFDVSAPDSVVVRKL